MNSLENLFSCASINHLHLPNRFIMAPMSRYFSKNNVPDENVVQYYRRRAEGAVGLIVTEGTCINHIAANGYRNVPYIYGDESLKGWKAVVDAVHGVGGKIFAQLWHVGAYRNQDAHPNSEIPAYSPSGLLAPDTPNGVMMSVTDIEKVIAAYALAAKEAKQTGFDGVEIHGGHGYLIDQFFWEGTNRREDQFGGSLAKRTRFAVEVVQAIKREVGRGFPLSFRWSQWKQQDYRAKLCQTPAELEMFLSPLVLAGIDMFHCSTRYFWEPEFASSSLGLAGWTKKITGKSTVAVGNVGIDYKGKNGEFRSKVSTLEDVDERIGKGEFDFAAVGRSMIANSDFVSKIACGGGSELESFQSADLQGLW